MNYYAVSILGWKKNSSTTTAKVHLQIVEAHSGAEAFGIVYRVFMEKYGKEYTFNDYYQVEQVPKEESYG